LVSNGEVLRAMIEVRFASCCLDAPRRHSTAWSASLVEQHHFVPVVDQSFRARQASHPRANDSNSHLKRAPQLN
jgi:hypothetical protein